MNPQEYLTKLTQCTQQGKALDLTTGECVDAFPPPGYTPPGNVPPPPGTTLPTGHVLISGDELKKLEAKQAELEKSVRTWQIVAAAGVGVGLIAGTIALVK